MPQPGPVAVTHIDPIDLRVGRKVRARRLELGVSQAALAERLGVSFQQVQKYERGANRISCSTLVRIAQALAVRASWLLDEGAEDAADAEDVDRAMAFLATPEGQQIAASAQRLAKPMRRAIANLSAAMAGADAMAA